MYKVYDELRNNVSCLYLIEDIELCVDMDLEADIFYNYNVDISNQSIGYTFFIAPPIFECVNIEL